jgi:hypothetical protein
MTQESNMDISRHRLFADFTGSDARRDPAWKPPERYVELSPGAGGVSVKIGGQDFVLDEVDLVRPANDDFPCAAVGLSGFAQTGKTTVANYIESKYGFRRQHIAEPLRAMLRTLLERYGLEDELITRYLTGDLKEEVIPCLGVTSRHAQITLGTEWGRDLIDDDLWARLWSYEAEAAGGKAMNDSVRFPNEEAAIQGALGGFTIMIERPGTEPVAYKWGKFGRFLYRTFGLMWGVHDSERIDRLNPDRVVVNDGTLEALYAEIDDIFAEEEVMRCAV